MMFDARKISNLLLDSYDAEHFQISNLKINKVIFFINGWYCARKGSQLIRNHFEAWDNGPVIPVLFHEFKKHGNEPITSRASYVNYETGSNEILTWSDIDNEKIEFIRRVSDYYIPMNAWKLVELTHAPGGPWHQVRNSRVGRGLGDRIPNHLITAFFAQESGDTRSN